MDRRSFLKDSLLWSSGVGPGLLASATGIADSSTSSESPWSVVTIKVLNHVYTPLVFALGKPTTDAMSAGTRASTRAGAAQQYLIDRGVDKLSSNETLKMLKLNNWFSELLLNGTRDGQPRSSQSSGSYLSYTSELDLSKVALQSFFQLEQIGNQNHSLIGTKLRIALPDLCQYLEEKHLVQSPLGINCFMMGGEYDKAEGVLPRNAVLSESSTERPLVLGRTVAEYTALLEQSTRPGFLKRTLDQSNLLMKFDGLSGFESTVRASILQSVKSFEAALPGFQSAASLESERLGFIEATGQGQSSVPGNSPSQEFIAQCAYVQECLKLPARPLRNFSLFLNINDLDGKDLDAVSNNVSAGQSNGSIQAYSYIEGMRQLALGLNVLGKSIAEGEKLIVVVASEGGRGAGMQDSKNSFSLVLGPRGAGMLNHQIHGNLVDAENDKSLLVRDPAARNSASPWTTESLRTNNDLALSANANVGDVQMGVVEFLESQLGMNVRKSLSAQDGRFAKLKRF